MTESKNSSIPRTVQDLIGVLSNVGLESSYEPIDDSHGVVALRTEGAQCEIHFRRSKSGRWRDYHSTLTVHGEPHELAEDEYELSRIFRKANGQDDTDVADPLPEPIDLHMAPPLVQHMHQIINSKLTAASSSMVLITGRNRRGGWVIALETDKLSFRMNFIQTRPRHWGMEFMQVVVDGVDHSGKVRENLSYAFALMNSSIQDNPASPASIGSPSGAAGPDSAKQRKGTIMRN